MATESMDPEDAPGSNATSKHFHQQRFWDVATPQQKITSGPAADLGGAGLPALQPNPAAISGALAPEVTPREAARNRLSGTGCHGHSENGECKTKIPRRALLPFGRSRGSG